MMAAIHNKQNLKKTNEARVIIEELYGQAHKTPECILGNMKKC